MHPEIRIVLEVALESAPSLPVSKRVLLYRGLAELCGNLHEARKLRGLASDLDACDRKSRQFQFDFSQTN